MNKDGFVFFCIFVISGLIVISAASSSLAVSRENSRLYNKCLVENKNRVYAEVEQLCKERVK